MTGAAAAKHWQPGLPVISEQDRADWQAWRRARALELQRERRKALRRIDYYPSEHVAALIDSMQANRAGGDASLIINRIITEWAARPSGSALRN